MKLKNLALVAVVASVLQGCATPGADFTKLPVYADNRVGYTYWASSNSGATRVWTSGDTILGLYVAGRVFNARDIDSIVVDPTNKRDLPMHITVRLTSGETVAADFSMWGGQVDWLACNRSRACEFLDMHPSMAGMVTFKKAGNFLTSIHESSLETELRPGRRIEDEFKYVAESALPYDNPSYPRFKFSDPDKIADLREALAAGQAKVAKRRQCDAEAVAAEERSKKLTMERIIKESPPAEVQKRLAMWRSTQMAQPKTSYLIGWEHGCR